jgi:DNA-binding LytR/AlgR family response regulator
MAQLKIGIVEDDLLIAESMVVILQQIGYNPVTPVRDYDSALNMIQTESPDLLLIDIRIDGELDGIDLARKVSLDYGIPFIFVTANSDPATVNRAKEVNPYAYLVKPFNESNLFSSIEIAFSTYNREIKETKDRHTPITYLHEIIFIKENNLFHKVEIKDIHYIESENVYLTIHTSKKNYLVRAKLSDFINNFSHGYFIRVHRSFAINVKYLETINSLSVKVAGVEIPVHKNYKQDLLKMIPSI